MTGIFKTIPVLVLFFVGCQSTAAPDLKSPDLCYSYQEPGEVVEFVLRTPQKTMSRHWPSVMHAYSVKGSSIEQLVKGPARIEGEQVIGSNGKPGYRLEDQQMVGIGTLTQGMVFKQVACKSLKSYSKIN